MKISIIGGGAWGVTLAQSLNDNGHQVLIYDVNKQNISDINNRLHPVFKVNIDEKIKGTSALPEAVSFANYFVLALPTKFMRSQLKEIALLLNKKVYFINVSKGIEPQTARRVEEIVSEEISINHLLGYAVLTGPSHAEDLIRRKTTLLTAASKNYRLAKKVQTIFSNDKYLRVYTSSDTIGAELGGATKNAIAVVSGILTGLELGENARAALITRGVLEIVRVVKALGGREKTAYGLTGLGDLIVTASSENSRNYQAGLKIGQRIPLTDIYQTTSQTIEGIRSIEAIYEIAVKNKIDLPIIKAAYAVIFSNKEPMAVITELLNRPLRKES